MPVGRPRLNNEGDLCKECGTEAVRFKGYAANGEPRWDGKCSSCHRGDYNFPWLKHRKSSCEGCGHTPFFIRSLDVHQRDGDKSNNDPYNLMTLCATCHREIHGFADEHGGDLKRGERMFKKLMKALFN